MAVFRYDSFAEARDRAPLAFIDMVSEGICWKENPSNFTHSWEDKEVQYVNHPGFYSGTDLANGDALDL